MTSSLLRGGVATLALFAAAAAPATAQNARIPVETYRLDNGLRVVLSPNAAVPTVSVNVWYDVGARDEKPGRTGFAHLFEHMMFQGSQNIGRGDHFKLMERAGSQNFNGTTDYDRTNYYQTLPANRLNLGLWAEADRMRSLAVTEENFRNQRDVVKEEKRQRVDNAPYATALRAMIGEVPYNPESCFGYAHISIGSMADLDSATLDDVRNFHSTYYRPENATLTVTGGFVPAEAKALIQRYFGAIPRGTAAIPRNTCTQPFTKLPVRREFTDANAQLPAVMATFGLPAAGDKDMAAITLLNAILTDGESSRLNDRLVKRERAAVQMVPLFLERRGPGLAMYFMVANQGVGAEKLEALFDEELARVRDGGVTEAELARARNRLRAGEVLQRQSPHGLAEALQTGVHFHGDPNWVNRSLAPYAAVTAADVQRVARQYFTNTNRALAVITPAAAAKD